MRNQLLFPLLLLLAAHIAQAQCDPKLYARIFSEAQALQEQGQFIEAKNKYEAAKIYACTSKEKDGADEKIDKLFEQINRLRQQADSTALTAYANDLAYKSSIVLERGDRTTAFRLAEFALHYTDHDNPRALQSLFEAFYYNENPTHSPKFYPCSFFGYSENWDNQAVAFSPNGQQFAAGSANGTTKIWNLSTGKCLTLARQTNSVTSLAFSPDGQELAVGYYGGTAIVWDLKLGSILTIFEDDAERIYSVAFSPDGKKLATGAYLGISKIWEVNSGKILLTLGSVRVGCEVIAFSPDGEKIATGSGEKIIKIWDAISGNILLTMQGHHAWISSVAFSPDSKKLATCGDNTPIIWDTKNGEAILTLEGHTYGVNYITFSPDGKKLATGSDDKSVRIWDAENGKNILSLEGHLEPVMYVGFSLVCPDDSVGGRKLFTGSSDCTAKTWDLSDRKTLLRLTGHTDWINSVAFSPDGKKIATASADRTAKIWNAESGKEILTLEGHTDWIKSVAFSPDGKKIATASVDRTAKIWNAESGKEILTIQAHSKPLNAVAFSPDGKNLATISADRTAKIWNAESGKNILTLNNNSYGVLSVAFSPDGKRLAAGSLFEDLKIWNLDTAKATLTLKARTVFRDNSVAFSPDGKKLASGNSDDIAKIWDADTGKALLTLEGHNGDVKSVAFSPDGKKLATASADKTAKIWDVDTGKALLTLESHNGSVTSVGFSPDGKKLATGSNDTTVIIWELDPNILLETWQATDCRTALTLPQLKQYNLESLLDQRTENETLLISTRDVWQIKAFADLAASQASNSGILAKVEPYYVRAERLYAAALALQDDVLIRQAYALMLRRWASICKMDSLEGRAVLLETKANDLEAEFMAENNLRLRLQYELTVERWEAQYKANPTMGLQTVLLDNIKAKGWYQLLTGQFAGAEASLYQIYELDADDHYLHTYLASVLLLQGKTEAAMQEYNQWKVKPYGQRNLPTFREAFLNDLKQKEVAGIIPPEYAEAVAAVRRMLLEK